MKDNFEVPLLPSHKVHRRMSPAYLPSYLREYDRVHGHPYELETEAGTVRLTHLSADEILGWADPDRYPEDLVRVAEWVADGNLEVSGGYCRARSIKAHEQIYWLGLPDGTWWAHNSLFGPQSYRDGDYRADINGYMSRPPKNYLSRHPLLRNEQRQWTQEYLYIHETLTNFKETFVKAWARSRKRWLRQERKSGRRAQVMAEKAEQEKDDLHSARIATSEHIRHLITLLTAQLGHIENDTVTVKGVREIFDATNELTSHHAWLKKALKIR